MNNEDFDTIPDPDILPLSLYRLPDPPPNDDGQPEGPNQKRDTRVESFWAGRNHAMRHSARWAA